MRLVNLFTASVTWQFSVLNGVYEVAEKEIYFGIECKEFMVADVSLSLFFFFFPLTVLIVSIFLDMKVNL